MQNLFIFLSNFLKPKSFLRILDPEIPTFYGLCKERKREKERKKDRAKVSVNNCQYIRLNQQQTSLVTVTVPLLDMHSMEMITTATNNRKLSLLVFILAVDKNAAFI